MNSSRIETLRRYYEEDSSDPFTIYALALEYLKTDPNEASPFFDELLARHPDYIPSYYHAARCYDLLHRQERAIEILEKGVVLAAEAGDYKTRNEIMNYLNELTER